jgi:hypothetical protein
MAHYAKVDENNIVQEVLVFGNDVEADGGPSISLPEGWRWIQTSYNRRIRGSFAMIGNFYNEELDVFIGPKPYESWLLNNDTKQWEPPVSHPNDGRQYSWNEENQSWDLVEY